MKNIIRIFGIFTLAAVIVFAITACGPVDNGENEYDDKWDDHYKNTQDFTSAFSGRQVWEENENNKGSLSDLYKEFTGSRQLSVFVRDVTELFSEAGTGSITKGKLDFNIDEETLQAKLLASDDLLEYIGWYFFDYDLAYAAQTDQDTFSGKITFDSTEVKGNHITIMTDNNEGLDWEFFSGTRTSLSLENMLFVYVDKNCTLKFDKEIYSDISNHRYYTFDLDLYAGWNILCKKVTHTTWGLESSTSIDIKNTSDFRWVLFPLPQQE